MSKIQLLSAIAFSIISLAITLIDMMLLLLIAINALLPAVPVIQLNFVMIVFQETISLMITVVETANIIRYPIV